MAFWQLIYPPTWYGAASTNRVQGMWRSTYFVEKLLSGDDIKLTKALDVSLYGLVAEPLWQIKGVLRDSW